MESLVKERIEGLRCFMRQHRLSAFIVPSTDPHSGEYIPAHWESRKWATGFTGSAGTLVVTLEQAGLWTDSRYFIQAEKQLQGSGIQLLKDRLPETPSIPDWLGSKLAPHSQIGIHGEVNSWQSIRHLQNELNRYSLTLSTTPDPFQTLWEDRPELPLGKPFILPLHFSGQSCEEKLAAIRSALQENQCNALLLSALDEIAWTLNLRGCDVECTPLFVGYLLITEHTCTLYILPEKLTSEIKTYLEEQGVVCQPYQQVGSDIETLPKSTFLLPPETNYSLYQTISTYHSFLEKESPVCLLKAIKNPTEIDGFHEAMKRDGAAMVRFLIWLKKHIHTAPLDEVSIAQKLYEFRAQQPYFQGISFETIAGYQEHGAIVHYTASPESAAALQPKGLLLLDSGGQYLDGTTDITRTIALGPVTEAQSTDYTLVLKGFIALSMIEFPYGTCGTQLDVLARQFMWRNGINYGHGTGHGVGHFLSVHEDPHQIRMNHVPALLLPGMTVTNEPGIYRAGQYGIRTENTMLITASRETEFGAFFKFEPLTLCPIDTAPIRMDLMTEEEIQWLNQYHQSVYEKVSPLLTSEEQIWLKDATKPISLNSKKD